MKYRWKLFLLLLGISVIPIVGLRTFGIHNVHIMADALTAQVEKAQQDEARNRLTTAMGAYAKNLSAIREQIQMALFFQAFAVRQQLPESPEPELLPSTGETRETADWATARLEALTPIYRAVSQHLGNLILRQCTGLANGAVSVYPPGDTSSSGVDPHRQPWYKTAFQETMTPWSKPYTDPETGRPVIAVSLAMEGKDERIFGVTSIIVPVESLLEPALSASELPAGTLIFLCTLAMRPETGNPAARILVHAVRSETGGAIVPPEKSLLWLTSSDGDQQWAMLQDFASRAYHIREMPYNGRPCFWVYGPLPHHGTVFVFIVPRDKVIRPSNQVLATIRNRLGRVEIMTAGFLVFLVVVAMALALAFSRTVTKPLEALSQATQKLADGDFDTRVDIRSGDEFGKMGRIFNSLGPQLKAHYQVRRSLEVAMEIQKNLLPQAPPEISGLDIQGMTFYSDETGGDYFDYLCIGEKHAQRLCVAVGDVSGHGIPSALLMATVRALLRFRVSMPGGLDEIISDVNRQFAQDMEESGGFMTLFLARIDRRSRRLSWVRAGHEPAILYDPDDDGFTRLEGGRGLALGVMAEAEYTEASCEVKPGQIICMGTDGIWEARNPAGEPFGKERLHEIIRRYCRESAQTIMLSILDAVEEFRSGSEQEDDLTIVVIKVVRC